MSDQAPLVDPAAMWAYATAPIGEPTSEPHRDPDGPIHAVLAAANAVAPRCRLEEGTALVHARYEYPAVCEAQRRKDWEAHRVAEAGPGFAQRALESKAALDEAKRRTRRDVAAVIT